MPKILINILIMMLLIALAPLPYGYYMLLKLLSTVVFIWASVLSYQNNNNKLFVVFLILSLLFNPVFMINFPREIWAAIDILCAAILFFYIQYVN